MSARAFMPSLDSVVIVDFLHAGVARKAGESFPHRDLKLSDLDLRGLWLARLIDFVAPAAASVAPPAPPASKPQQPNQQHRR